MDMDMTQKPRVFLPWTCQWDSGRETWVFVNTETDEQTYSYDYERMATGQGQAWQDSARGMGLLSSAD